MKKLYILFIIVLLTTLSFGQTPTLFILDGPANGSTVIDDPETSTPGNATIDFTTTDFNMSEDLSPVDGVPDTGTGDGYIKWNVVNTIGNVFLDGGSIFTSNDPGTEYDVVGLTNGETYFFRSELVDNAGDPLSSPVVYSFTINIAAYIDVANLAELRAGTVDPDTYYRVTGQVVNTQTISLTEQIMYFQDGTGGIKVYDPNYEVQSYLTGDGVSNIKGHLELVTGELQFVPTYTNWGDPSTGNTPSITGVTSNDLNTNWSDYEAELVKIFDVTFNDAGNTFLVDNDYSIVDATGTTTFTTAFGNANYLIGGQNTIPSGGQDIIGIVTGSSITARNSSDFSIALSIDDLTTNNLKIYPNPTSLGYVNIASKSNSKIDILVFDTLGKQVLHSTVNDNKIDVSKLNTGIYVMKVSQDDAITTKKLVIQ
jgi:hypothetical protein